MVTSTTSWLANERPSYHGVAPVPKRKAPPWIHTITGRLPSSQAGVQMLSVRQSSSMAWGGAPNMASIAPWFWGAIGPKRVASRTPLHGCAGWGGRKRRSPTGGAA